MSTNKRQKSSDPIPEELTETLSTTEIATSTDSDDVEAQLDERDKHRCGIKSKLLYQLRQLKPVTLSDNEIIKMIRDGNPEGSTLLFNKHHRYILEKIIDITHGNWYTDDILQAGAVGLFEAAKRFDPSKKTKFLTYAHFWILKYIYLEVRNELLPMGGMGIGRDAKERLYNFIKYTTQGMSDEEIMKKLRVSKKALYDLKMLNQTASPIGMSSLDRPPAASEISTSSDDTPDPYNQVAASDDKTPEKEVLQIEMFIYVENLINKLRSDNSTLATFLEYELGLNGKDALEKADLCEKLKISRKDYEFLKREGNKYLRTNMIHDGWYDSQGDSLSEVMERCVNKVGV